MKQKLLFLLLALMLLLTGCRNDDPPHTEGVGPGRMVRRIEVAIVPEDPELARTYSSQEHMNGLLALLRSMQNDTIPETEPDIHDGQSLYTVTVTYANGQQSVYYLLGHTYLRFGDEDWCVVTTAQSRQFVDYLREHPGDDAE